jgi:hypothetical protein
LIAPVHTHRHESISVIESHLYCAADQSAETHQPSEDGDVTISRAAGSLTFPARFMLVAVMNPCPCGFYGDMKRQCRCSPRQIEQYRQRISGPLLDRKARVFML